ncbi:DNA adenine methylase [Ulvibacterium marinum]|uniref:Site-specific DNA-methyltransferase (adenine-specific) n=1 Tax=Ulvibacterium marinum TaxID=2419782 RepID=A0A3B0C2P2_9FLAO|nr:Dam family site-specific DNA-(adenine-N6)-methyltransferase [Ulvibacterium marinum]RKN80333.1 Dam family site-specific DNA-(adenine-N6)-methyltransferase [Ulvibacterium marinum]
MTNSLITKTNDKLSCEPFLRWAGGKRWLIKDLHKFLPGGGYSKYHEIFLGGAAVFFHLRPKGQSYLNDFNPDLINTYQCVKDDVMKVLEELKKLNNTKDDYYKIRSKKYRSDYKKAAKFIYLNQTSFNGIYRVNLNGEYNVPYGFRTKDFIEEENLKTISNILKPCIFSHNDFADCLDNIKKNDLVFLDPPYTVAHNNNGFIKYNQKLFSLEDQYRLHNLLVKINEIGAHYILTNAAHYKIKEIFGDAKKIYELSRASLIGGKNAKRGQYKELLITNI